MGTIRKGILGGFSGKVGTVVGGSWKGISYMRSLPLSVKKVNTKAQASQRTKFAIALNTLIPMTAFLRTGWKLYAHKQSAFNAAMSHTLSAAITGVYPDYVIDPAKVLVSRGSLTPAFNAVATRAGANLEIVWSDNSGLGSAKQTDKALIAILNSEKGEAITDTAGAERTAATQTFQLPNHWQSDTVHVYLGFISEDGREIASSVHLTASAQGLGI